MKIRLFVIFVLSTFLLPLNAQKTEPIRIGLLIQDKASLAAKQGAELAVRFANEKGGTHGRPIKLVVRSMEGPWGTGSKQAVNLIFEENVWALLGSHDGRNAHLVEQAATKSTVVFASAWASDPTLSQAFVPWFFNCVPNDQQQASILIEEIYNKRKFSRIATITDDAYDSNQALQSFLKYVNLAVKSEPVQFLYNNYSAEPDVLADQIRKSKTDCIVLFCRPSASLKIIRLVRQNKMSHPVFGSLLILNENELSEQELQEFDSVLHVPSGTWSGSKCLAFRQEYQKTFGKMPGLVAAYAFDGMNFLIEAARTCGVSDREKIQNYLKNAAHDGVTGTLRFDNMGNRMDKMMLMEVKNGIPFAAGDN
jgi:branched-chain amino acid transport system substrate-binding protein